MKILALLLISVSSLLSGCYVYPASYHDHGEQRGEQGRDGGSDHMNRHDDDRGDRDRRQEAPRGY